MVLLIAAAVASGSLSSSSASQAKALVRVERPALASEEEWKRSTIRRKRRERIVKNDRGEEQLQRLFEYE